MPDTTQKVRHIPGFKPLVWTAGGVDTQPIPSGYILREIHLRLSFTLTTSANLAAAAIAAGGVWGLVKRLRILAGNEIIKDYTGEELRFLNAIWYRTFSRDRLTLGATSTAIVATLKLPFWDRGGFRPMDTALNTSDYSNLRIEVTWGTFTDVASTGTAFSVTPQIDWTMEISTYGVDTPNSERVLLPTRIQRDVYISDIAGAVTDRPYKLSTGLHSIRDMLIYTKDSSGNDAANKISTLKLISVTTTLLQADFQSLRDGAYLMKELREPVISGAPVSPFQDSQFNMDAWLYLDFAKDSFLSEAMPTALLPELKLLLTTPSAVSNLTIVTTQLYPPMKAAA